MKRMVLVLAIIITAILIVSVALAQSGDSYDLSWSSIDGGSGTSSGGPYQLGGTIGQPDAGSMSGSDYTLNGGFWISAIANYGIYLPIVLRG